MLEELSPFMDILFSLRQGDPLAMILYVIQLEPLLARLEQVLEGLTIGPVVEKSLGYVDDVAGMGDKERDLLRLDEEVRAFEMASGAILNRNHKSVVLGLGSWAGRMEWPLPWIQGVVEVKLYGITVTADPQQTIKQTWERIVTGVEKTVNLWKGRDLPTLRLRQRALEVYALSKVWYAAQVVPMPKQFVADSKRRQEVSCGEAAWSG